MGNKILKIAGGIIGILIIGIFILSLTLDGIVKSNIQQVSGDMLQTEVDVDDVSISIFDGQGTIDGLAIQNPEDFDDRAAIQFKQIKLQVDLVTLLSDTVVVKDLIIQNPSIYVVQTAQGNNLRRLQNNMGSSSGSSYEAHLVIDHLLINEGDVQLRSTIGEERNVKAQIARLELTGIGRKGSNTVDQTVRQILEPVLERALTQAAKEGLKDVVKDKIQDLLGG